MKAEILPDEQKNKFRPFVGREGRHICSANKPGAFRGRCPTRGKEEEKSALILWEEDEKERERKRRNLPKH